MTLILPMQPDPHVSVCLAMQIPSDSSLIIPMIEASTPAFFIASSISARLAFGTMMIMEPLEMSRRGSTSKNKSPDILYMGKKWEIKSPTGSKRRTLENNVRAALKQSCNIIIDLSRIKVEEGSCLRFLRDRSNRLGKKVKIMVIKKNKEIVEL